MTAFSDLEAKPSEQTQPEGLPLAESGNADEISLADWEALAGVSAGGLEELLKNTPTEQHELAEHHQRGFLRSRFDLLRHVALTLGHALESDLAGMAECLADCPMIDLRLFPLGASPKKRELPPHRSSLHSSYSMAGFAMSMHDRVLASNLATERRFSDNFLKRLGVVSALMAPIREGDQPIAALGVYRTQEKLFTLDDVRSLEVVAQMCNVLLDRFRRMRDLRSDSQPIDAKSQSAAEASNDPESDPQNARSSPRRHFRYLQMIAPVTAGQLPGRDDFYPVHCKDISSGGIAFYAEEPPNFETLIVALGRPPYLSRFMARVAYVEQARSATGASYLVGCQFTERLYQHF